MREGQNGPSGAELDHPRPSIAEDALVADKEARLGRLAAAVILQAVDDLSKVGSPQQRQAARDWFAGKREDGLSFELCCKLLDRDTEDIRRKLEARYSRAFSTDPPAREIKQEGDSSPPSR